MTLEADCALCSRKNAARASAVSSSSTSKDSSNVDLRCGSGTAIWTCVAFGRASNSAICLGSGTDDWLSFSLSPHTTTERSAWRTKASASALSGPGRPGDERRFDERKGEPGGAAGCAASRTRSCARSQSGLDRSCHWRTLPSSRSACRCAHSERTTRRSDTDAARSAASEPSVGALRTVTFLTNKGKSTCDVRRALIT
eukprot:scaffold127835_cov24-Tisochrysis_lutea.AAC.1